MGEALEAAGAVIAARTEMAMVACSKPSIETAAEMGLMVTEKMAALGESGRALGVGASKLAGQGAAYASGEFSAAQKGMMDLAACKSPFELMQVQNRLMTNFLDRTYRYAVDAGETAAHTGEVVVGPLHTTVTANRARLDRRKP